MQSHRGEVVASPKMAGLMVDVMMSHTLAGKQYVQYAHGKMQKRWKTIFIEDDFLATVVSDEQAPLLIPHMDQPTSLPHFRKLIGYLSSINSKSSIACTNGAS
jgi:hypothetical protein